MSATGATTDLILLSDATYKLPTHFAQCVDFARMGHISTATAQQRLGVIVRTRREALGKTQEALGIACKMERSYIQSVEAGNRNVTLDTVLRLSIGLRCKMYQLMPDTPADDSK